MKQHCAIVLQGPIGQQPYCIVGWRKKPFETSVKLYTPVRLEWDKYNLVSTSGGGLGTRLVFTSVIEMLQNFDSCRDNPRSTIHCSTRQQDAQEGQLWPAMTWHYAHIPQSRHLLQQTLPVTGQIAWIWSDGRSHSSPTVRCGLIARVTWTVLNTQQGQNGLKEDTLPTSRFRGFEDHMNRV